MIQLTCFADLELIYNRREQMKIIRLMVHGALQHAGNFFILLVHVVSLVIIIVILLRHSRDAREKGEKVTETEKAKAKKAKKEPGGLDYLLLQDCFTAPSPLLQETLLVFAK